MFLARSNSTGPLKVTMRNDRTLYIDNDPRMGVRIDDNVFHCNHEFWEECSKEMVEIDGESVVTADAAAKLADLLEPYVYRYDWKDNNEAVLREFISFLRAGGFGVVDLIGIE